MLALKLIWSNFVRSQSTDRFRLLESVSNDVLGSLHTILNAVSLPFCIQCTFNWEWPTRVTFSPIAILFPVSWEMHAIFTEVASFVHLYTNLLSGLFCGSNRILRIIYTIQTHSSPIAWPSVQVFSLLCHRNNRSGGNHRGICYLCEVVGVDKACKKQEKEEGEET